jgi:hypothetical protein
MTLKQRQKYFTNRKASGAIVMIALGCLLTLLGIENSKELFACCPIGAGMATLGIAVYWRFKSTISDATVDSFCHQMADNYYSDVIRKLETQGIQVQHSMYTQEYLFENHFRARLSRMGKDGFQRSSIYSSSCFLFDLEGVLHYFKSDWSLISNEHFETEKKYPSFEIRLTSTITRNQVKMLCVSLPDRETICFSEETGKTFLQYLTDAQTRSS